MKAPAFSYVKPATLAQCLALLAEHGETAQIVAGGQSLMPMLNLRMAAPSMLIDINGLTDLTGISSTGASVRIGALERHNRIGGSEIVKRDLPLLAAAVPHIAHVAIRSRGTIGGSLALADPAAEWPACCLALGAEIELASLNGSRRVAAADFFQGLYTTARASDELVTAVHLPVAPADAWHVFDELARRRGDFAIAGLALMGRRTNASLADVRIAFFGVADRPVLATRAMEVLEGHAPEPGVIAAAVKALRTELDPPDDPAYPAGYRRQIAGVLLERALKSLSSDSQHAA